MKKLEGKVALVTGGSRGIGKAIVFALAEEGANVGVIYVKNKEQAEKVCETIRKKNGVKAIALKANITVPDDVKKMADAMLKEFGKIDILVNNAGIVAQKRFLDTTFEEWQNMLATHLNGAFLCTKAVLPSMLQRRQGRIINFASHLAQKGVEELVPYCAAKGGVISFTKALAREVVRDGILVNCVAPGPVKTEMLADVSQKWLRELEATLPLGRFALPEEIAAAVVFLASPDSNLFVGQTLCPNSGSVML